MKICELNMQLIKKEQYKPTKTNQFKMINKYMNKEKIIQLISQKTLN